VATQKKKETSTEVVKILEKDVCKTLRVYWKRNGWFYARNQQGLGCKRGVADYTVIYKGKTVYVEAKSPVGRQSPPQKEFEAEVKEAGGSYIVVHSLEEFQEQWNALQS
jgi:deferrochelatase/peroxidase EfeB